MKLIKLIIGLVKRYNIYFLVLKDGDKCKTII